MRVRVWVCERESEHQRTTGAWRRHASQHTEGLSTPCRHANVGESVAGLASSSRLPRRRCGTHHRLRRVPCHDDGLQYLGGTVVAAAGAQATKARR